MADALEPLRISRFDPAPCGFPPPRVSLLPRRASWGKGGPESVFLGSGNVFFSRGRYALRAALRALAFGPGDQLLVPSYHCRTMLDPALDLGGHVAFYPLMPSLALRMDVLERIVQGGGASFKALLYPHYFGFPQSLTEVAAFCRQQGIALIEDCSHAFFGTSDLGPVGSAGDFAIASPYKFFPSENGGIVRQNGCLAGEARLQPPSRRDWRREAKGSASLLKQWLVSPKPVVLSGAPLLLGSSVLPPPAVERVEVDCAPSSNYLASEGGLYGQYASAWIMKHADRTHLAGARRARFIEWLSVVEALPRCRPLVRELPEGVVPYMFPLLLDEGEADFYRLKQLGMPIWRWDDMAVSECEVASRYRKRLIHLPCHQALGDSEMNWMTLALRTVLSPVSADA